MPKFDPFRIQDAKYVRWTFVLEDNITVKAQEMDDQN